MANSWASFLFIMFLTFTSGGMVRIANAENTWCVAKPSSDVATLMENYKYACSEVDCKVVEQNCSSPDNPINRASVAMNLYYAAKGRNYWNCNFTNSALMVITDPSYGDCKYP